jgi:hypothetical protein
VTGQGDVAKQTGPPTLSEHGYIVMLRASSGSIWLNPGSTPPPGVQRFGELVVSVQDAQGRPVDGVSVEFQLGSSWAQSATVTPQRAVTRDGSVQAIPSISNTPTCRPQRAVTRDGSVQAIVEPRTTGIIPVIVRVDNVTRQARFTAEAPTSGPSGR